MDIDLRKIISPEFIFDKNPPVTQNLLYLVIGFVLMVALAFLGWWWLGRKSRKLYLYRPIQSKVFNLFFYSGMLGLLLSFFHWQQMTYLGSRFFFLVLFLLFILIGLSILDYRLRVFPKEYKNYLKKQNFKKYLPQKKVKN